MSSIRRRKNLLSLSGNPRPLGNGVVNHAWSLLCILGWGAGAVKANQSHEMAVQGPTMATESLGDSGNPTALAGSVSSPVKWESWAVISNSVLKI